SPSPGHCRQPCGIAPGISRLAAAEPARHDKASCRDAVMTAPELRLPATLTGLRQALSRGDFSVPEALSAQRHALERHANHWQCVTHLFAADSSPDPALPLAGVGLAHKDIFAMRGRLPHCGTPSPVA